MITLKTHPYLSFGEVIKAIQLNKVCFRVMFSIFDRHKKLCLSKNIS